MFGMVIASGVRALAKVKFDGNYNLMLVAVSIGMSMIPLTVPNFFQHFPDVVKVICQSGITLGSLTAVVLNILFNGFKPEEDKTQADQA